MSNELTACQTVLAAVVECPRFNFRIQNLFCHGIIDKHGIADGAFCHIFSDRRAPDKKNDDAKQHQRVKKGAYTDFFGYRIKSYCFLSFVRDHVNVDHHTMSILDFFVFVNKISVFGKVSLC